MGSYLTFSTSGDSVEFAAVRTLDVLGIWLGALAVLAVLILIIVLLVHRHKRKARRRAEALARSASAVSQAEQIVRGEDADASTADEAPARADAAAPQRSKMPLRRMRLCPLNLRQSPPPWQ